MRRKGALAGANIDTDGLRAGLRELVRTKAANPFAEPTFRGALRPFAAELLEARSNGATDGELSAYLAQYGIHHAGGRPMAPKTVARYLAEFAAEADQQATRKSRPRRPAPAAEVQQPAASPALPPVVEAPAAVPESAAPVSAPAPEAVRPPAPRKLAFDDPARPPVKPRHVSDFEDV